MFLLSPIYAAQDSLGVYGQNDCVDLLQICGTCTYNNVTSIVLPNSTRNIIDVEMTRRGAEYNFTFCNTQVLGDYLVNGVGDLDGTANAWAYDFSVTTTGKEFTQQKSTFYVGSLIVLCFLFVISLLGFGALPGGKFTEEDNSGEIISINSLRHFKLIFAGISWGLLTMISYLIWNISVAYLETGLLAGIFQTIFILLMIVAIIGLPVIFAYTLWSIVNDIAIKKMIDRGIFNG